MADGVGEGFVLNGPGVEDFSTVSPGRDAESLEVFLPEQFVIWENPESDGADPVGGESEAAFEGEGVVVEGDPVVGGFTGFPIDDDHVGVFPEVADGAVLAEDVAESIGEAAADFAVAGGGGAEFADTHEGDVDGALVAIEVLEASLGHGEEVLCTGKHGDCCSTTVVALTLFYFCDRGARIAGHDGEVIAQRSVRIIAFQTHANQADQFGAFDGFPWTWWEKFGKNVTELFAQAHLFCIRVR